MARLLLLANPAASGFTGALLRSVAEELRYGFELEQEWPDGAAGTRRVAAEAAAHGVDIVAAMGGDGVVHHAANGLAGSRTALAVIPTGTTNVFARLLGVPQRPRRAAQGLRHWRPRAVRLARVAWGVSDKRLATFAVGAGFDGAVIARAERRPHAKLHFGSIHFARSALGELANYRLRPQAMVAEAGVRRSQAVAVSVQVQQRYTYFGAVSLGFGDQKGLSALIARRLRVGRALAMTARLAIGRMQPSSEDFEVWDGVVRLTVEADPATPLQADGEPLGAVERFTVTGAEEELLVVAPTKQTTEDR